MKNSVQEATSAAARLSDSLKEAAGAVDAELERVLPIPREFSESSAKFPAIVSSRRTECIGIRGV